jgi:hypothetical protein
MAHGSKALQENKMPMFDTLARYERPSKARIQRKSERVLNSLPMEIRKDIGWLVTHRHKTFSSDTRGRIF